MAAEQSRWRISDRPTGLWPLGAIGEVVQGIADVEQCLGIIVTTPRGSDPLRPTFGADIWRYIDFPISLALPAIVSELTSRSRFGSRALILFSDGATVNDASAQSARIWTSHSTGSSSWASLRLRFRLRP